MGRAIAAADKEEKDILQFVKRHMLGLEFPIPAGSYNNDQQRLLAMSHLLDGDER
jgi:hypothetical protein